jgi:hypothetical protein
MATAPPVLAIALRRRTVLAMATGSSTGPSPELTPLNIVEAQLAAFQRGSDDDIAELYSLISPDGKMALQQKNGMDGFRWAVRREPRWLHISARPHAALLNCRSWTVVGQLRLGLDSIVFRVSAMPFFPDAPHAESEVVFNWHLCRQLAGLGAHPSAAEALGDRAGCWLVNDIEPDYSGWQVLDPSSAGKAPDSFRAEDWCDESE